MTIQSFVEKKTDEKAEKEVSQLDELTKSLQRVHADFDNYRKRAQSEQQIAYLRGKAAALKELLAFVDTLDAAAAHQKEIAPLRAQLHVILAQNGVKPIETVGKTFDPFTSECMQQGHDAAQAEDIVLEEFQKGYYFHTDVLRTAKVKVNTKENTKNEENQTNGGTHHE